MVSQLVRAQENIDQFYLQRDSFTTKIDTLRKLYGNHKVIPQELETECLTALSFYPELKDTYIEFRFGKIKTTMASRPKFSFFLTSKANRRYVILIGPENNAATNLDRKELSFNALVGWIGHELGHVVYYTYRSNYGILLTGIKYNFDGYKLKMEHFADIQAIQHSLGFALYEGDDYTINHSAATKQYIDKQVKFYLSPGDVLMASLQQGAVAKLHNR